MGLEPAFELETSRYSASEAGLLIPSIRREWLAGVIAGWSGFDEEQPGDHLVSMVCVLRRLDDAAYLARLDALIQERFPGHPRLP